MNRASRPFFLLHSRGFHPWADIGTQPKDGVASMAKHQLALDARGIKRFFDARAKGITPQITGGKKHSDEGAALFGVRVHLLCYVIDSSISMLNSRNISILARCNSTVSIL